MKKLTYLLLALLPLFFVACNNASNNNSKSDDKDEPEMTGSLVGEWKCDKVIEIEDDDDVEYIDLTLSIRDDNTYSMTGDINQSGTWVKTDDMLYFYANGEPSMKQELEIKKLTTKELVLISYYYEEGERFAGEKFYFSRKGGSNPPSGEGEDVLDGTKWKGTALQTEVELSFIDEECYIVMKGYVTASAVATYRVSAPDVFITITGVTGDSDDQLHVGDIISATFDLAQNQMIAYVYLYGETREVFLTQTK